MNAFIQGTKMNRRTIRLFFALFSLISLSVFASGESKADKQTIQLVKYFLKTPTAKLDPNLVPEFIAIDSLSLPKKLRNKYAAKKMELYSLRKVAAGKKEGLVRTPNDADPECKEISISKGVSLYTNTFSEATLRGMTMPGILWALNNAHFSEIDEIDMPCIAKKTQCSEHDMVCDFTLSILVMKKGKKEKRRYFLYEKDPLTQAVILCTHPNIGGNTNFFNSKPVPLCSH
jgi:hypothetical protein